MKLKSSLGLMAGVLLLLSAGAHTILGWKSMSERLAQTNAPADLVRGLQIGWTFGGPVMIVFALICFNVFWNRFRGERVSTFAPAMIAVAYIGFAAWAAVVTGGDPFFMLFLVPGVLIAIAALP